jgi:hypothetical protein
MSGAPIDPMTRGTHAVGMATLRVWDRGIARRLAAVEAFGFPSGARQRFGFAHPGVRTDGIRTVEAATRQWFRLAARNPGAKLAMPSLAVDAMWHEVTLHTREYDAFCAAAFGRPLHHIPASAVRPESIAAGLSATYRLAGEDEPSAGPRLPLLFRVDRELAITGGHRYIADCGGRAECYPVPGARCLRHIAGPQKSRNRWRVKDGPQSTDPLPITTPGCGCGG